ncbi:MAG: M2 family metallopeptidase [Bacteroidota bacterium]
MMDLRTAFLGALCALLLASCGRSPRREADEFLAQYYAEYQPLYARASEAQWLANTDISPAHDSLSTLAEKEYSRFVGSREVIERARALLARSGDLDSLQILQLNKILLNAARYPGTVPGVVEDLIRTGTRQTSLLYGFEYRMPGPGGRPGPVSTNDLDRILVESSDPPVRLAAWTASKEVGRTLGDGLERLQTLRNQAARAMGYSSYFDLQVADYGMTTPEMMALMEGLLRDLRPLYRELHTWARYELARRYRRPVPDMLPAHWLPNRWGQNWPGLVRTVDLDGLFRDRSPEWITEQAERFYVSLGFPGLPESFWKRSDLYPAVAGSGRRKNNHASAWHMDLQSDCRSLMSVVPNAEWFGTAHHELGHIYYYMEYSVPDVPLILREGANRSYHEGIGDLMDLASSQRAYLAQTGIMPPDAPVDSLAWLLNDALAGSSVVFIPFAAGTMSHFEFDLYERNLPRTEYNRRWWSYVERFQGVVPPSPRGDRECDAATKTHINDDAAQYYDYALSCVLKFQLHDHIARKILRQDPRNCNYYGSVAAGEFLRSMMRPGARKDWRAVLRATTGEDLSARAMLEYYRPLWEHLRKVNAGRRSTLPEL